MRYLVSISVVMLAGCAGPQLACSSANWQEVGERDGLLGVPPRIETYAYQCQRQNVQVATAAYMDGWWVGNATYRDRTAGSEGH